MNDQAIEQEIQAKGKTAPRVTPADIELNIASEHYFTAGNGVVGAAFDSAEDRGATTFGYQRPEVLDLLTFCVLVLRNGFTVTGESACASPENFDAEIGRNIARQNAVQKIWPLMGYMLKQQLYDAAAQQPPPRPASPGGYDNDKGEAMRNARFIEVSAGVRYWDDARVNGTEDVDGKIPLRNGDYWEPVIDLRTGAVRGWPAGVTADVHYKVCDAGEYWLRDEQDQRIAQWRGYYVPDEFLCVGTGGHGDYIIFKIGGDGLIEGWRNPSVDPDEWEAC